MENHHYTAVPILTADGNYHGTLTEGDLLWYMKEHPQVKFEETEKISISAVTLRLKLQPISVEAHIEDLLTLALEQNFVPVTDGRGFFIGIVRRHSILAYYRDKISSSLRP